MNDDDILSPDDDKVVFEQLIVVRVLCVALALTSVIYVGIGYFAVHGQEPSPLEPTIVYALGAVALSLLVVAPFVRRALLPPRADTSLGTGPTRKQARAAVARLLTALVVTYALNEAIAIFGLLLSFLSHDLRYVIGFAGVALVGFAVYFPRAELMRGVLRGAEEDPK